MSNTNVSCSEKKRERERGREGENAFEMESGRDRAAPLVVGRGRDEVRGPLFGSVSFYMTLLFSGL